MKQIIINGDFLDKGPQIKETIEFIYKNKDKFFITIGNHENYVYNYLKGVIKKSDDEKGKIEKFFNSIEILEKDDNLKNKFFEIFEISKNFYVHKDFIITHAPSEKKYLGKIDATSLKKTRDFRYPKQSDYSYFCDYIYEFDDRCAFAVAEANNSHPIHVFGHVMTKDMSRFKNKVNIDTGCVSGGSLTSIAINKYRKISSESVKAGSKIKDKSYKLHNFFV